MNEINVRTITNFQRHVRSYGLPKLPIRGLGQFYEHALVALPGKPTPSIKDHRKAKNSYFSRYRERWVERLKSSSSMSKFGCIIDLKVCVHEDDLFIVHDALVLMTAKEMIEWMKENNCFHHRLLTMNELQDRTPFSGRPVGNSPKFMPLYNSLNRDILHSLRFHCVLSRF